MANIPSKYIKLFFKCLNIEAHDKYLIRKKSSVEKGLLPTPAPSGFLYVVYLYMITYPFVKKIRCTRPPQNIYNYFYYKYIKGP